MLKIFDKATTTIVKSPVIPRPSGMAPQFEQSDMQAYREVANRVGVTNAAYKREMVLHELAEMGLRVFNYAEVDAFLDSIFGAAIPETSSSWGRGTWGWRALREKDKEGINTVQGPVANGSLLKIGSYQQAVPMPVLLTVERLEQAVPGLHFFVSDRVTAEDIREDPFLMVTAVGMRFLVIERWDEPSFKG